MLTWASFTTSCSGSSMRSQLTVGLAQIDSRLGALDLNVTHHLKWIERARDAGVEVLLFPELSLTGYRLLHLTSRVAIQPDDSPEIQLLADQAGDMAGPEPKGLHQRVFTEVGFPVFPENHLVNLERIAPLFCPLHWLEWHVWLRRFVSDEP